MAKLNFKIQIADSIFSEKWVLNFFDKMQSRFVLLWGIETFENANNE